MQQSAIPQIIINMINTISVTPPIPCNLASTCPDFIYPPDATANWGA